MRSFRILALSYNNSVERTYFVLNHIKKSAWVFKVQFKHFVCFLPGAWPGERQGWIMVTPSGETFPSVGVTFIYSGDPHWVW